jgi:hypothetical protein
MRCLGGRGGAAVGGHFPALALPRVSFSEKVDFNLTVVPLFVDLGQGFSQVRASDPLILFVIIRDYS